MGLKITELSALTTPISSDVLVIVNDPVGTPISKKITVANLHGALVSAAANLTANALIVGDDGAKGVQTSTVLVSDAGDLYNVAWVDYFGSSTIIGWVTPSGTIYYKRVGKIVFVSFTLTGTSNATTVSFTLPYTNAAGDEIFTGIFYGADNGAALTSPGVANLGAGSATVAAYKGMSLLAWTNLGIKTIYGNFWYEAA